MAHQIMYSSESIEPLSEAMIEGILNHARTRNEKHNITGVLFYIEGVFFQVLEGDKDTARQTMERIKSDNRHGSIKVFYEGDTETPIFHNWSMAYLDATPEQLSHWLELKGTTKLENILGELEQTPNCVPDFLLRILKALG
jgi:hypothetical protein